MPSELYDLYREENAKATRSIGADYDYGLVNLDSDNGHWSDKGKLPNHPTFSDESKYSTKKHKGGKWSKDKDMKDVFTPSKEMMDNGAGERLIDYFKEFEPNAIVQYPPYKTVGHYTSKKQ